MPTFSLTFYQSLSAKIASCPLDANARLTGFLRRQSRKITPTNFLLTACLFALQNHCSFSAFAQLWALLHQQTLSKQAVQSRFHAAVGFVESILQSVMASLLPPPSIPSPMEGRFKRILVQDSTCLKLPAKLAALFPGAANQTGQKATLKIQATFDLLKHQWLAFRLSPFTVNDQKASPQILDLLQKGDLIIRDLGYLVMDVLRQIHEKGAYFLSRSRLDLTFFCPQTGNKVSLLSLLQNSGPVCDVDLLWGKEKFPIRVVAVRLPEEVANQRRHKARKNRDRRTRYSEEYYRLLDWNIFITNVPQSMLSASSLMELYGCRWRIEIIFKAWKSHFRLGLLTDVSADQLKVVIFSKLLWICWFSVHWTSLARQGFQISFLKLAQWWSKLILPFLLASHHLDPSFLQTHLLYYCPYEKRKDRLNFLQKCASLG